MAASPLEVGGIVALSLGLIRLLERSIDGLIARRRNGQEPKDPPSNPGHRGGFTCPWADQIREVRLLGRTDQDGRPLVYVPRNWGEALEELRAAARDQAEADRRQAGLLAEIRDALKRSNGPSRPPR